MFSMRKASLLIAVLACVSLLEARSARPGGGGRACTTPDAVITVEILTDKFGDETTWQLVEQGVGVVASGGPYADNTLITVNVPVCSTSCYDFTIFDASGDGICCTYGNGFYNVYLDGNLVASGGAFGASETVADIGIDCSVVQSWACCVGTTCISNIGRIGCVELGGQYLGDWSTCGRNPCDDPSACCAPDGTCSNQTYDDCLTSGAGDHVPHPGLSCVEFNCPTPTADECPDAILIACDTPVFGDNSDATARWGICSTGGAPCYSTTGLAPYHGSCGPGTCSVTTAQWCLGNADCPSGETCVFTNLCQRAATNGFEDPFYSCSWQTEFLPGNPQAIGRHTVWYKFVAQETSVYLATCNSTDPNLFNTALVLYEYTDAGNRCGSLVELDDPGGDPKFDGCGEDECPFEDPAAPGFSEICSCALTIGQTYYLEVIDAAGTPGTYQLDIECRCLDCYPGACCETTGNRCFDFFGFQDPPVAVSSAGCTADNECLGEPGCNNPGDCICLPHYFCTDYVEDFECPTNPNAIGARYGGNGTTCEPEIGLPQIDPPCGLGACCRGNICNDLEWPLECLGNIGQGQSWNGEGSECVSGNDNLECPKACTLDGYGHPNDTLPETTFRADSTGNGICEGGVIPCSTDGMCTTSGLTGTCLGEGVQIVADSFVPLQTPISELCWWGVFRRDDAGGSADDCADDVTAAGASNFTIRFLEDSDCDGQPETAVAGGTFTDVPVLRSGSGVDISPEFEWEFHHGFTPVSVTPLSCYFVEITATNSPENCVFRINRSTVGDATSAIDNNANGVYDGLIGSDVAWTMDVPVRAHDCRPNNDNCADIITSGAGTAGLDGVVQLFQTTYASDDGVAHPKNLCGIGGVGTYQVHNDIWYRYVAECSGLLTVDVCSSGYDTAMVVYNLGGDPWSCPTDDTYLAGCTDDDCGTFGLQSLIADVPVTAGDRILIRLGGHITAVGCGVMRLSLDLGSSGCTDNSQCPDDGLYCNGNEFCDLGACQCAHTGQDCPDDGLFCNGDEICIEAANTCGHTGDPCDPDPCIEAADTCGIPDGDTCGIVGMESCFNHGGACGVLCLPIDCTNCGSVEPRLQLGVPPTLVLDLGACGCNSASVAVSCTPNAYGGTATVDCGTSGATVTFSAALPDRSCCTLTFSGDIFGKRTLALLEGDVNRDCGVSASDTGSTEARVGRITTDPLGGTPYDVNRDCSIAASDFSSVSARVGRVVPPCPCP